jgi:hypothetical protein
VTASERKILKRMVDRVPARCYKRIPQSERPAESPTNCGARVVAGSSSPAVDVLWKNKPTKVVDSFLGIWYK